MSEPTYRELVKAMQDAQITLSKASTIPEIKAALAPALEALKAKFEGRADDYGEPESE